MAAESRLTTVFIFSSARRCALDRFLRGEFTRSDRQKFARIARTITRSLPEDNSSAEDSRCYDECLKIASNSSQDRISRPDNTRSRVNAIHLLQKLSAPANRFSRTRLSLLTNHTHRGRRGEKERYVNTSSNNNFTR